MMVPHMSAIQAGPKEARFDHISINENHSNIVKFNNEAGHDYAIIESRIVKLAADAPGVVMRRFGEQRKSKTSDPSIGSC